MTFRAATIGIGSVSVVAGLTSYPVDVAITALRLGAVRRRVGVSKVEVAGCRLFAVVTQFWAIDSTISAPQALVRVSSSVLR
jgi:hypothetical protein